MKFSSLFAYSALVAVLFCFPVFLATAHAATPSVSFTANSADYVAITVVGDANSVVTLYYIPVGGGSVQSQNIGSTNGSGYFSTTLAPSSYSIAGGSSAYVTVNGQQSPSQTWPVNYTNNSNVYFSQNTIYVGIGATQQITIYGSGGYSISTNNNSGVASATLNGNTLTIQGIATGSTSVVVCQSGGNGGCGTVFVNVNTGNNNGSLSFSQTNPYLTVGQVMTITISGGYGSYYIPTNSNPSVVNAAINGSVLTLSANTNGTSYINVCSSGNNNFCGSLNVTVSGTGGSSISFSQTNPSVGVGQTVSISLWGGNGSYYVSNNNTSGIVQGTINGNTLSLYGVSQGSGTLTICSSGTGCSSLYITVTGYGNNYQQCYLTYPYQCQNYTYNYQTTNTTSLLSQIAALKAQLAQLLAQVQGGGGYTGSTGYYAPYSIDNSYGYGYDTGISLSIGSSGAEVAQLQTRLAQVGFYNGPVTGYYGTLTASAVASYQRANGLPAVGTFGPATRALLYGSQAIPTNYNSIYNYGYGS